MLNGWFAGGARGKVYIPRVGVQGLCMQVVA